MKGTTFKRCGCKEPVTDAAGRPVVDAQGRVRRRELGAKCPKLRRPNGTWNPRHGTWWFLLEVPRPRGARRLHIRQGGHATQADAEEAMARVWRLLSLADEVEDTDRVREEIAELIRQAIRARQPLPDYAELRRRLTAGQPVTAVKTVAEWLTEWLASKSDIRRSTLRSYTSHVRLYLIPYLGRYRLDRLRVAQVQAMFAAIEENNQLIAEQNAARRAVEQAARQAARAKDRAAARTARAQLASMPPYRRPVGPATRQRIRATLRSALSDAAAHELVTVNVAKLVKLPAGKPPKALVWTEDRVARWRKTGEKPSPVMVWTAAQTAAFLARAARHPWYALYHLIAHTGLRRGEACGLRWADIDLQAGTLTVSQQIVQLGWDTETGAPKSDAGERTIALDAGTLAVLKAHRRRQHRQRLAHGPGWIDTDLVFTEPNGAPLHPAQVTDQFTRLAQEADLPPIRLHDLRHGAATHALSAGVDIKVVQEMLGHSSSTLTRDTYTSVVDEAKHAAAEAIAALLANPARPHPPQAPDPAGVSP